MRKSLIAGIAVAALALTGCAADTEEVIDEVEEIVVDEVEETTVDETDAVEEEGPGTIVDIAAGAGTFDTLVAAVQAAGLVDDLSGEGPLTVFAPTDEAFGELPPGLVETLLEEENLEVLKQILLYHVVAGAVLSTDLETGNVTSLEGSSIAIEVSDAGVTAGGATVTTADIDASNGVIHVIDAVILPEGFDLAPYLG